MDLTPETRPGFGNTLRLLALCTVHLEKHCHARMRDSFGMVQLWGKPREKWKHCKVSLKGLGALRQ